MHSKSKRVWCYIWPMGLHISLGDARKPSAFACLICINDDAAKGTDHTKGDVYTHSCMCRQAIQSSSTLKYVYAMNSKQSKVEWLKRVHSSASVVSCSCIDLGCTILHMCVQKLELNDTQFTGFVTSKRVSVIVLGFN